MAPLAFVLLLLLGVLAGPAYADVSNVTADPSSPTNAAGGRTIYVTTFNTSGTGGLSAANGDQITITLPTGTDPTGPQSTQVYDTTVAPNTSIGFCSGNGTVVTCSLNSGKSIGGGDAVKVVVNGVTNPGAGSKTLQVRTSAAADSMNVASAPYTIVAANPVTNVAVDPSDPTRAAGGRTSYSVTFKASATGGLSGAAGSKMTITFPAGTDPTGPQSTQVFDTTAAPATDIGFCGGSGTVVTCFLNSGKAIAAGHDVRVVVNGVTNPGAGSKTLTVSTTSDPSAVTSPSYSIVAANPVTNVAVDPSDPTRAAGGRTSYSVTFKASATGGMSGAAGSEMTITFPAGTDPTGPQSTQVFDTTVAPTTDIGFCDGNGTVVTCFLNSGKAIAAGHNVRVVVNGVTNPGAGSKTLTVSTTSDPSAVTSPSYSIVAANPVTNVAVDASSPTNAAGGRTSYSVTFKASATGGMSGAAGSKITITFPAGTDPTNLQSTQVFDTTAAPTTDIGFCDGNGTVVTCFLNSGKAIAAGHDIRVVVNGVTNPGAGSKTLTVSTTSDPSAVTSPSYSIVAANPVTNVAVDASSPTNAAGGRTIYSVTFKASTTGGMSATAGSEITITAPAGTDLSTAFSGQVFDTTAAPTTPIGFCGFQGTVATCFLSSGKAIAAGHDVRVVGHGVTNPGAGSKTLTVSTTSDPSAVTSPPYTIVAANPVTNVAVDPSTPTRAAGGRTSYSVTFKASATGGMSADADSEFTITFPAGTDLSTVGNTQVFDTTAAPTTPIGFCGFPGTVVTCFLDTGKAIAAGHNVRVVFDGVTNPGAGSKTLTVSTTSDPSTVTSSSYSIVAANPVTNVAVDPSTPTRAAGGRTSYSITFKASATGGMSAAADSEITIVFPTGTDLSTVGTSEVFDTTVAPNTHIGFCGSSGGVTETCRLSTNEAIAAGHNVKVVIDGVTNPGAGSKTLNVSTTSDPAVVASSPYTIVAAQQISQPAVTPSPSTPNASSATYTVTFTVSSTGGLNEAANSEITVTFPAGTDLTNANDGEVYDTTAAPTTQIGGCFFSGQSAICDLFNGEAIAAGHAVRIKADAIANPAAGNYVVQAATTSDPSARNSAQYSIGGAPPAPTVTSISPTRGPTAGGTSVTIRGTNFTGATAVKFGSAAASTFAVNSGTQITATAPAGTGTVDVTVTTPGGGTSATGPADRFTYAPAPAVSSLSPTSGPTAGGTSVTIHGSNFTAATSVRFGSAAASGFTVDSATQITAISPAGTGVVDVTVSTPGGTSATSAADRFTYVSPVVVTEVPSETPPPLTAAPTFTPGAPNVTGTRDASLSAVVNPRGLPTTVRFEYGLDPALTGAPLVYNQRTPDQAVGADFTDHAVTANLANLLANATYHVRVVASNSAGTATGADQVFKTKANPPPEPAVLGEEVVGAVVDGLVLIKLPGKAAGRQAGGLAKGTGFVPLTQARNLPVGTEVDSRRGTIDIVTATAKTGKTQSGEFGGGLFRISQSRDKSRKGLAEMALLNSAFKGAPTYTQCAATGKTRAKKPPKSKVVQLLHANVKGKFRTRGHYAAATVRGTQWDMTDRCDGTLTVVKRGTVVVTDFRRKKDVVVQAGKSYLAKAP